MKFNLIGGLFLITSTFAAATASASIVSVTGDGVISGVVVADVSEGASQNANIQAFSEDINVLTTDAIDVDYDVTDAGAALTGFSSGNGGGTLVAGTYNSYLLHFDPTASGTASDAVFTFAGNIVALIVNVDFLTATDSVFNSITTDFNSGDNVLGRRSENTDTFTFVANALTVNLLSTNATNVDHIRVITLADAAEVSAPTTMMLILMGFAALGFRRFTKQL